MKKALLFLTICILYSCVEKETISVVKSISGKSNSVSLDKTLKMLNEYKKDNKVELFNSEGEIGEKVDLYLELLSLFNTDNFDCGCDEKLKKKLKRFRPKNKEENESGFIPKIVLNNAFYTDSALLLDRSGSSILAHSFQYKKQAGSKSKLLFARNSPTVEKFSESDYFESNPSTYDHFLYTLDCSGFLSAAVSATIGVNKNSIKASANAASKSDKSLIVLGGVMYSPLYQAYNGERNFSENDSITKLIRISILESILSAIPSQEQTNNTQVFINTNYQVILTSNSGTSSFNGEAKLGITGGVGFGFGDVSGEGKAGGSVQRKSSFTRYKTYLTEINVNAEPNEITILSIKEKINSLKQNQ